MSTDLTMTHNILKTDKKDTEKNKTKKNINLNLNKKQMWDLFDKNILNKSHLSEEESVECIYQSVPDRENCDLCGFSLQITEEGYFSCTNTKCGILYKDKFRTYANTDLVEDQKIEGEAIQINDIYFGNVDVFYNGVIQTIDKTEDLGSIKVVYQGCNEKGFCYPPISKEIQVDNLENF